MIMLPSASAAAVHAVHECVAGPPTAASYTWNFKQEANDIFQDVRLDALQAEDAAANLQSFQTDPDLGWEAHAHQLAKLRSAVNDMGSKLCRLETIRRVVDPWQQNVIDRLATNVTLMADNTEDAILFVNQERDDLWMATYKKYVDNLYNESSAVARNTGDAVAYSAIHQEYQHLRNDLGVKTSS